MSYKRTNNESRQTVQPMLKKKNQGVGYAQHNQNRDAKAKNF